MILCCRRSSHSTKVADENVSKYQKVKNWAYNGSVRIVYLAGYGAFGSIQGAVMGTFSAVVIVDKYIQEPSIKSSVVAVMSPFALITGALGGALVGSAAGALVGNCQANKKLKP